MEITRFKGEYRFLSNFYPAEVVLDGITYPTVEHAFQAAKTFNPKAREKIRLAENPGDAKRMGRSVSLRADWEEMKLKIMKHLLAQKFCHTELRRKLLETGDSSLIEGNTWGDRFWGVCDGVGENWLGRLLVEIRSEIRAAG